MCRRLSSLAIGAAAIAASPAPAAQALIPLIAPVVETAYGSNNRECDGLSSTASADGRYVFFSSACSLVPGIGAGLDPVLYRFDRSTDQVQHAFVGGVVSGVQGGGAGLLHYSADDGGTIVAIHSLATNLVPDDTNARADVFVKDFALDLVRRASVGSNGQQSNGDSFYPALSRDGRYVAFATRATNLSGSPVPQGGGEMVVVDLETGVIERIATYDSATFGSQVFVVPRVYSVSTDARRIVFAAPRSFVGAGSSGRVLAAHDRVTAQSVVICTDSAGAAIPGACEFASASSDGELTAFAVTLSGRVRWFVKSFTNGNTTEIGSSAPQDTWHPLVNAAGTHALALSTVQDVDRTWCNVVDIELATGIVRPVLTAISPDSFGLGMYCPSRLAVSDDRGTFVMETGVEYVRTGAPYFGYTGSRLYVGAADWVFRSGVE